MFLYLIEEGILDYGEVSVRADRTEVEDGDCAAPAGPQVLGCRPTVFYYQVLYA